MSLVTRCPRCTTLFRVQPTQLQARAGQVRCGRCMHIFDGFAALDAEHAGVVEAEAAAQVAGDVGARRPTEPAGAAAAAPLSGAANKKDETPPRRPVGERARVLAQEHVVEPMRRVALLRSSPDARRVALAVVLALLLVTQIVYSFRSQLGARYPLVRSIFSGVCSVAGCDVSLPQRPDLVKIEASDVHMLDVNRTGLIQLTATLRSYANYDLAYPALDLVLTNANEHALARRIFVPDEYLDQTRDPHAGIAPRAEITIALDLDTGDLNAAGFRLDLVAAPAPQ